MNIKKNRNGDKKKKTRKKGLIIVSGIVITLVITGFSLGLFTDGTRDEWSGQTIVVTRRDMSSSVLATGIIKPCVGAEVRVGSRVSGVVKRLHVKIGDGVKKGQLLGELDPMEFRARYNQAAAAVENAEAELNYAVLSLERLRTLRKKNCIAQAEVDEAVRIHDVAQSVVKQAKANLDDAGIQLGYTQIRAPISGVVSTVSTQEGETVAAGFTAPTFVVIIDLERLEVRAYVDETDIGRIQTGAKASFTVDTYPGVDFKGEVTAIYPGAEMRDNVVNYITVIDITGIDGCTLRPEMTATVRIFQEQQRMVLSVPKQAINREAGKNYVYTLNGGEKVKRLVSVGRSEGNYIEITDGLKQGEKIIIDTKEDGKKW